MAHIQSWAGAEFTCRPSFPSLEFCPLALLPRPLPPKVASKGFINAASNVALGVGYYALAAGTPTLPPVSVHATLSDNPGNRKETIHLGNLESSFSFAFSGRKRMLDGRT